MESINSNVTCNELSNNEEEGIDIYNHLHEDNIELSVQSDYEHVQQQVTEEDDYSHVTTFNPNQIQISGDYGVISWKIEWIILFFIIVKWSCRY